MPGTVPFMPRRNQRGLARLVLVLGSLALIAAACGEGDSGSDASEAPAPTEAPTTAAPTTTTTVASTTTAVTTTTSTTTTTTQPGAPSLPDSPVVTALGADPAETYKVDLAAFAPLDFTEDELPVPPGAAEVRWYVHQDRYVAAFSGFDPSAAGPLCPGASILTSNGWEFVSNAPTEEGACEGFPTLTDDPLVEAKVCQGTLFYVTLVPSELQGTLFGTLEALAEPGILVGLTSTAESADGAPEIDLGAFCA